jgi:hypothetical protein
LYCRIDQQWLCQTVQQLLLKTLLASQYGNTAKFVYFKTALHAQTRVMTQLIEVMMRRVTACSKCMV